MAVSFGSSLEEIDWEQAKTDLAADRFDNGRSAAALRRSFECSQHVAVAGDGRRVVGMARLLSDGVCNAYFGLQTDGGQAFYAALGFERQPEFWSRVAGTWLDNDANG